MQDELEELREFKEVIKTVAKALYRHECWQEMPWGSKQVLWGLIRDEVEKDAKDIWHQPTVKEPTSEK